MIFHINNYDACCNHTFVVIMNVWDAMHHNPELTSWSARREANEAYNYTIVSGLVWC